MRSATLLVLIVPVSATAEPARQFRDWVAGCDNTRACIAIGTAPRGGAYLRVLRTGDPGARAVVELVVVSDHAPGSVRLHAAVDGSGGPGDLTGQANGESIRAIVPVDASEPLLTAMQATNARTLRVTATAASSAAVSLQGAIATFRYMDDTQGRAGTVTALAARGSRGADAVPLPPAVPVLPGVRMVAAHTLPTPAGIGRASAACRAHPRLLAYQLGEAGTLWGVCSGGTRYRFTVAGPRGRHTPVSFPIVTRTRVRDLTAPAALSDDGLLLTEGAGSGRCGVAGAWSYNGSRFDLAAFRQMPVCRGVLGTDWPVTWRARVVARQGG